MIRITEKYFEEVFNESLLLQEIYIKEDFLDVIDDVANRTKDEANSIDRAAIIEEIKTIADDFTKGKNVRNVQKRWFDYDDLDTPPYYVKNVNSANEDELKRHWAKNKEAFLNWIKQPTAIQEIQSLINRHKGEYFRIDGTTNTIQGEINAKFVRDCFVTFLNTLADNTHGTYKFFKHVDENPLK